MGDASQGAKAQTHLRQGAVQLSAWVILTVTFFAFNGKYEWAAPDAFWWGTLAIAWSMWRILLPIETPTFQINLHHLDLRPPRRDQWIPLTPRLSSDTRLGPACGGICPPPKLIQH